METTTMITTPMNPALVPFLDAFDGATGGFVARDPFTVIEPKSAHFVDPRPTGPPV